MGNECSVCGQKIVDGQEIDNDMCEHQFCQKCACRYFRKTMTSFKCPWTECGEDFSNDQTKMF